MQLLESYPDEPELITSLTRAYFRLDDCKQTANEFVATHKANARLTGTQVALLVALQLRSSLELAEARRVLSAQAAEDEASFELWLELGKLYAADNQIDLSLQALLKVIWPLAINVLVFIHS